MNKYILHYGHFKAPPIYIPIGLVSTNHIVDNKYIYILLKLLILWAFLLWEDIYLYTYLETAHVMDISVMKIYIHISL